MRGKKRGEKGISPLVTTVLLILLVVIIAVIIILWYKGIFNLEHIYKFEKPVQENCQDVDLKTNVNGNEFSVTNIGNVPVYQMKLKIVESGGSDIQVIDERLPVAGSYTFEGIEYNSDKKITIIPVLLGKDDDGNTQEFSCDDYGIAV